MSKLSIRAGSGKKKKGDSKKAGGGKDLRICSEMCSAFCLQPSGPSGPNLARRSGLAWGVGGWGSFFFWGFGCAEDSTPLPLLPDASKE